MACTCAPLCPEGKGSLVSDIDILSALGLPRDCDAAERWEMVRSVGRAWNVPEVCAGHRLALLSNCTKGIRPAESP